MIKTQEVVLVRKKELENWKVSRLSEGGFQRNLRDEKVRHMADAFGNGAVAPVIIVGKIGKDHVVIDGQHRFEARKRREFTLYAQIIEVDLDKAAEVFVDANSKMSRVGLTHRLAVDPRPVIKRIRSMAARYKIFPRQVYNLLLGITRNILRTRGEVSGAEFDLAETILKHWSDDVRWNEEDQLYSYSGTLMTIGRLIYGKKDPVKVISNLKNLDFRFGGEYGKLYGSNSNNQRYILDWIGKKSGIVIDTKKEAKE